MISKSRHSGRTRSTRGRARTKDLRRGATKARSELCASSVSCAFTVMLSIVLADDLSVVQQLVTHLHARGQDEQARALEAVLDVAASALAGHSVPIRGREFLTTSQAAAALGVSRQTIKNWVQAGHLRGALLGGRTLIHRDEVQAQLDRLLSARPPTRRVREDLDLVRAGYESSVNAVPPQMLRRLEALHEQLEQGQHFTPEQRKEIVALERKVMRAASGALAKRVLRRTTSTR